MGETAAPGIGLTSLGGPASECGAGRSGCSALSAVT